MYLYIHIYYLYVTVYVYVYEYVCICNYMHINNVRTYYVLKPTVTWGFPFTGHLPMF